VGTVGVVGFGAGVVLGPDFPQAMSTKKEMYSRGVNFIFFCKYN
jgi:hypothetical protein